MPTIQKYFALASLLFTVFCSCQPSKKAHQARLYLQGMDSAKVASVAVPVATIQQGDKLSVVVYSDNAQASSFYNPVQAGTPGAGSTSSTGGVNAGGYLVDAEGNILMYGLGPVHVEGLTKLQLKQLVQQKLDTLLKNPYVEIRFLNKRITVLGEIAKPGIINMPEERLNLLDAIALSGDLTPFGRNDNILVVREENGKRTTARLDIKDPSIFKSQYFYLEQGDFVYVEPLRKKPIGTDVTLLRNISLATAVVSTLAIVYSIFRR